MTLAEDGTVSGTTTYTTLVTGTNELPLGSRIYPNPAKDRLNLEITGLTAYTLYDLGGRLLLQSARPGNTIDLSGLEPGVYQLRMMAGGKMINQKIVKL